MGSYQMKKLVLGLLATFMIAASLVAVSGTSAQAACTRYGGCPSTSTSVSGTSLSRVGQQKQYTTAISVDGSNAAPRGTVRIVIRGAGQRTAGFTATERKNAKRVNSFSFGARLPKGKYTIQAFFSSNGSQENSSSSIIGLKNRGR